MMIMTGNRGAWFGWLAATYPGRIGSLFSPRDWKTPVPFAPHALDNGAFTGFDERGFLSMCEKAKQHTPPLWIVVPDRIGDRVATLALWDEWEPRLRPLGWPLAMAMQDGMTPRDFRGDIAFIGGSYKWKWRNLSMWADVPRFHVGRVNTNRHLWQAHEAGAESCDGTGWFRGGKERRDGMLRYLQMSVTGSRYDTPSLLEATP